MNDTTKSLFSLEEKKVSTLIVAFLFFSVIGGYKVITKGDIPPNLVNVLLGLITAIAGVNALDSWVKRGKKEENQGGEIDASDNSN